MVVVYHAVGRVQLGPTGDVGAAKLIVAEARLRVLFDDRIAVENIVGRAVDDHLSRRRQSQQQHCRNRHTEKQSHLNLPRFAEVVVDS